MHVCSVHIINVLVRIAVMWITRRRSNKCQRHFFNDVFKTSSFENFLCLRETILYGAYFVQNGYKTIKTFETTFREKGAISISLPLKVSVFGVFLVRIFPHSDWIRRDTNQNAWKSGPEKLRTRTLSMQCFNPSFKKSNCLWK